jgi:DNA-binding response OmpR family regulator
MEADVDMGADPGELSDNRPAILLVEDEPATRAILSRQLDRAGYAVIAVSNGAEALDVLEKQFVPLLLTDWDMPEMNGVELCKAVREMSLDGYVYTILLNTRDGKANVLAGLAAGADDYLTKPPDDNELRARINRCAPRTAASTNC